MTMFYQWHLQNQGGTIDEEIIAQLPENSAYLIASETSGFKGSFGNLLEKYFGNTGAITTVSFFNDPIPSNKINSALIVSHPKSKNKAYAYISDTGNELIVAPEKSEIEIYANNLCNSMFSGYSDSLFANVTSFNFTNFNVSKVSDMRSMFYYCEALTSLDVSNWNTSNVTDMSYMFYYCSVLSTISGLSNWNTSNVTNMNGMFGSCGLVTSLDVSNFNTSNVTDMSGMFSSCDILSTVNVSNWDTSNVTDMSTMFLYCDGLTSLNLTNWNVSKVKNFRSFLSASLNIFGTDKLTSVGDLSNWDVSSATNMSYMFYYRKVLSSVGNLENWDVSNVTNMSYMFTQCKLPIPSWYTD